VKGFEKIGKRRIGRINTWLLSNYTRQVLNNTHGRLHHYYLRVLDIKPTTERLLKEPVI